MEPRKARASLNPSRPVWRTVTSWSLMIPGRRMPSKVCVAFSTSFATANCRTLTISCSSCTLVATFLHCAAVLRVARLGPGWGRMAWQLARPSAQHFALRESPMSGKTILIELLLAGFFAVACLKARVPAAPDLPPTLGHRFRLPSRLERLRRSRWQWFAMVGFMLVLRLQEQL